MIVVVNVVIAADIKSGAVLSVNFIRGLMKYLTAERQLVGDLPLEQPSEEPIVFVTGAFAVIDPVPPPP